MLSEADLDEQLSRPSGAVIDFFARIPGDLLVLGASGKMGPSLALLARRGTNAAGVERKVTGVARFRDPGVREQLEAHGVRTIACDLTDRQAVHDLPEAPLVILMAGQKFGTATDQPGTWGTNVLSAVHVAERFPAARIVAFSTGNVYPFWEVSRGSPRESDPVGPVGEYAQSALGRERVLEFLSVRSGTPMAILRLNYAVECRYGILHDLAQRIVRGEPIDLTTGHVNLIWQRDANAIALRALEHVTSPATILNVTGPDILRIRDLGLRLGEHLGMPPVFTETEGPTALLSDARAAAALFGPLDTSIDEMVTMVAEWVRDGGRSLEKPTHYDSRDGAF